MGQVGIGSPHLLFCVICLLYPNHHHSKPRLKYPVGAILRLTAATDTGAPVSQPTGRVPCGQEAEDGLILSGSKPTWEISVENLKSDWKVFTRVIVILLRKSYHPGCGGLRSDDGQATIAKPKATKTATVAINIDTLFLLCLHQREHGRLSLRVTNMHEQPLHALECA